MGPQKVSLITIRLPVSLNSSITTPEPNHFVVLLTCCSVTLDGSKLNLFVTIHFYQQKK